ncbi:MAG: hypothetical protein ACR2PY_03910 [Salinispira sp.]
MKKFFIMHCILLFTFPIHVFAQESEVNSYIPSELGTELDALSINGDITLETTIRGNAKLISDWNRTGTIVIPYGFEIVPNSVKVEYGPDFFLGDFSIVDIEQPEYYSFTTDSFEVIQNQNIPADGLPPPADSWQLFASSFAVADRSSDFVFIPQGSSAQITWHGHANARLFFRDGTVDATVTYEIRKVPTITALQNSWVRGEIQGKLKDYYYPDSKDSQESIENILSTLKSYQSIDWTLPPSSFPIK